MSRAVIRGGAVHAVYSDTWAPILMALGAVSVARASEVEWEGGEWVARLPGTGEEIARGPNRAEVIAAEVEYLERRL